MRWGYSACDTSYTCTLPSPKVVRRPRIGREPSSRIPGRDVRCTGVAAPKQEVAASRPRGGERVTGGRTTITVRANRLNRTSVRIIRAAGERLTPLPRFGPSLVGVDEPLDRARDT